MNWFEGDISTAVSVAKEQNSIFMVFIDDETEKSAQLLEFLNIPENKDRLNTDNFVRVKIMSKDETFEQFAKIYKDVPKPSVYFIGQKGLVYIVSETNTVEEITKIILSCDVTAEKNRKEALENQNDPAEIERRRKLRLMNEAKKKEDIEKMENLKKQKNARDFIKKRQNEERLERERILLQIANDRAEVRQYIPPNFQNDSIPIKNDNEDMHLQGATISKIQFRLPDGQTQVKCFENNVTFETIRDHVRDVVLQGVAIKQYNLSTTYPRKVFTCDDDKLTLFELNLFPTAVILVIPQPMTGPALIVARSGGPVNLASSMVWNLYAFILSIFGKFRNMIGGIFNTNTQTNNDAAITAAEKRANDNKGNSLSNKPKKSNSNNMPDENGEQKKDGVPYRRSTHGSNIHRITDHMDSDDENSTWNGNSTQQQ